MIVLQQCHRESEEKWKRLSRQVMDMVLPALSRQQVRQFNTRQIDVTLCIAYLTYVERQNTDTSFCCLLNQNIDFYF